MKLTSRVKNTLTAHIRLGESKKETKHSRNRTDIIGHRTKALESTEETQKF